jgi:transposase
MTQGIHKSRFIGADIASRHVDVAEHGQTKGLRISNEPQALTRWLKTIPAGSVLAMESTGRYHLSLARLAHERGVRVYVLNARDVRHYAQGVGQRGKTDRLDAQLLARYVAHEHAQLHAWQPPTPELQRLDDLLRHRAAVVRHKEALRQSLGQDKCVADMMASLLGPFNQAIKTLDAQLRQAIAQLPEGKSAVARITSVPGLGLLNGAALLRLFTRLGSVGIDVVIAFTGLDPRPMDSGNKRGVRRLSKRGNPELRRLLFNAAMSASRTHTWQHIYQRERDKGLSSTAALVVLARKLVRVAFSLFKSGSVFDPTHGLHPPRT